MISASHNPYRDNGIKLFAPGGTKLPRRRRGAHRGRRAGAARRPRGDPAQLVDVEDSPAYREHVVDVLEGRRLDGLRIVVDAANGAASRIAGPLFGARPGPTSSSSTPSRTAATSTPGAGRPTRPRSPPRCVAHGADLGLALDGDADRLIAVDHTGAVVDGDHIIAICARDLRDRGALRHDTVVVTVMTNLGFRLGDGGRRHPRRRDRRRRPLRAGGAGERRVQPRRRAERPRHLPRPGDDRRRAAHRVSCWPTPSCAPGGRSPTSPRRR